MDLTDRDKHIIAVLSKHSCLTSKEISSACRRYFDVDYLPATISGVMRKFYSRGYINKSQGMGTSLVYWLTDNPIAQKELDKL